MATAYDNTNSTQVRSSAAGTSTGALTTPSFADDTFVMAAIMVHNPGAADSVSVTDSGDWTVVDSGHDPGSPDLMWWIGWRIFDSTEAASYTWSWTNTDEWSHQWIGFTGVDTTTPFDVSFVFATHHVEAGANDANADPASIANSADAAVLCLHNGKLVGQYTGTGEPSGYSSGPGSDVGQFRFGACLQSAYHLSPGANEDPPIWGNTLTSSSSNRPDAWTFALSPQSDAVNPAAFTANPMRRYRHSGRYV